MLSLPTYSAITLSTITDCKLLNLQSAPGKSTEVALKKQNSTPPVSTVNVYFLKDTYAQ